MCGIVDSDTGKPLAIFGSRYGQEIRDWFKLHQEIKVISRDGSHSYAEIIRESLPDAIQVSDRFHLIKNLKDTKDIIFTKLGGRLPSRLVHRCTDTICRRYEEKRKTIREQRKRLEKKESYPDYQSGGI